MTDKTPATEAGRDLVDDPDNIPHDLLVIRVLAIEAQARAADYVTGHRHGVAVGRAEALDPKRLATAIRMVERLRDEKQGDVWQGPEPEWYDEYTKEVLAQYEALKT